MRGYRYVRREPARNPAAGDGGGNNQLLHIVVRLVKA
jgi:hypothetical protein